MQKEGATLAKLMLDFARGNLSSTVSIETAIAASNSTSVRSEQPEFLLGIF